MKEIIWRYERKYLVSAYERIQIEALIKQNKFLFREIFQKRKIRSLYFDDLNYGSLVDNLNGLSDRKKYRLRWYGETFEEINNPQFEIKIKKNLNNRKKIWILKNIHFDKDDNQNSILRKTLKSIINPELKFYLRNLKPITFVEYDRRYFQSICGKIRITFDNNLVYRNASNPIIKNTNIKYEVIEIKYKSENDDIFLKFAPTFFKKYSRNSKYINSLTELSIL
tara:strand:+ start:2661 stop:3332 length:672 start_codon:yes stop_codon:yes gene_type:complete